MPMGQIPAAAFPEPLPVDGNYKKSNKYGEY